MRKYKGIVELIGWAIIIGLLIVASFACSGQAPTEPTSSRLRPGTVECKALHNYIINPGDDGGTPHYQRMVRVYLANCVGGARERNER